MSVMGIDNENKNKQYNLMVCLNCFITVQENIKTERYGECCMDLKKRNIIYCNGHYNPSHFLTFTERKIFE